MRPWWRRWSFPRGTSTTATCRTRPSTSSTKRARARGCCRKTNAKPYWTRGCRTDHRAAWRGFRPSRYRLSDRDALKNLERDLKLVVFGQDEAIGALSAAIKMTRAGLGEEEKPIGSFLFAGPTGVGKTEVTRQLAMTMGIELIRFDMSEYMEAHSVSRLVGAPPGYVGFDQGGLMTEAVTKNPHAVLLLDEIEKAHPDVFNILLQVMDHGTLTDTNGREADFSNVILVMTTNAGAAQSARRSIGFTEQDNSSDTLEVIRKTFAPEFRNRLDAIINFKALDMPVILQVVDKFILELEEQLASRTSTFR